MSLYTGYSIPKPSAFALVGSGANDCAILTPWADMFNGRCQDATRFRWISGAQTTGSFIKLQFTLASPIVAGMVGLFGLRLLDAAGNTFASSAALRVAFTGKRAGDPDFTYALGGNTATQRSVKRSDGSYAVIGICDLGLTPIVGWQLEIWNDQNGVPTLPAQALVDLGKPFVCPAFDQTIDGDWELTPPNDQVPVSPNDQPWPNPYPPGRVLSFSRRQMPFSDAYVDGTNPCWQSLCTLAGNGDVSVMVPRWGKIGALDAVSMHATALFGLAKFGPLKRTPGGDYFSISGTMKEVPALLA